MPCPNCGRGFHDLCLAGCSKCHPVDEREEAILASLVGDTSEVQKKQKKIVDPGSTGRKRAAILYPIDPLADCEWRMQADCGGGRRPIIGCIDGKQQHRHHGPVKKTTQNREGNVHRICTACHVRWHELNDLIYEEREYNLLPHDPRPGTLEEVIKNDTEWRSGIMKTRFELASSVKGRKPGREEDETD